MSKQFNFWADPVDSSLLHSYLIREFSQLQVIPKERGTRQEMAAIDAELGLAGKETMFLVPCWAQDRVLLEPLDHNIVRVLYNTSPVI